MMTDPAFAIKRQVECLVEVQIVLLRKKSRLSSLELDEYHTRSEKFSALYRELETIKWSQFHSLRISRKAS